MTTPTSAPRFPAPFAELVREHDDEPLTIRGKVPEALRGTHYQVGPASYMRGPDHVTHAFDGDGAMLRARFDSRGVHAALRFVATRGREQEQRAGRRLFGGYGTPLVRPFRELFLGRGKNPANTGVLLYQGRAFALCEAGLPEALDDALRTVGPDALSGVVLRAMTAHPKRAPKRATTITTGVVVGARPKIEIHSLPDHGAPRRIAQIDAPGVYLLHDFAVTARHIIFVIAPLALDVVSLLLRRKGLAQALSMRPGASATVLVVPLDAPDEPLRIPIDACYVEHLSNAFERDGEIVVDATRYPSFAALQEHVGGWLTGSFKPLRSKLARLRIDLRARRARFEDLEAAPGATELPRFHPSFAARPHRHLYTAGFRRNDDNGRVMWNAILRHDRESGEIVRYAPGDRCVVSEPQVVAHGEGEEDAFVLALVHDLAAERSRIDILDARSLADGPIASAEARELWPFLLHGAWKPTPG